MRQNKFIGDLMLCPAIDRIYLIHEVMGRQSEMELSLYDQLKIEGSSESNLIEVIEFYEMKKGSIRRREIKSEMYAYQGEKVVVTLTTKGNEEMKNRLSKRYIKSILEDVKIGDMDLDEAMQLIHEIEHV